MLHAYSCTRISSNAQVHKLMYYTKYGYCHYYHTAGNSGKLCVMSM